MPKTASLATDGHPSSLDSILGFLASKPLISASQTWSKVGASAKSNFELRPLAAEFQRFAQNRPSSTASFGTRPKIREMSLLSIFLSTCKAKKRCRFGKPDCDLSRPFTTRCDMKDGANLDL